MNRWLVLFIGIFIGGLLEMAYIRYSGMKDVFRTEEYRKMEKELESTKEVNKMFVDMSGEVIGEYTDKHVKLAMDVRDLIDEVDSLSKSEVKQRLMELVIDNDGIE